MDTKIYLKAIIRFVLNLVPLLILRKIADFYPRIVNLYPPDQEFIFRKYLGNIKLNINTKYPIERGVVAGIYDPTTFLMIDKIVKKGDICLDIGANVGGITFAMAKRVGESGKVFAFEPGAPIFQRLKSNIEMNQDLKNIIIPFQLGISDKTTNCYWKEHQGLPGNGSIVEFGESNEKPVAVTTVDDHLLKNPIEKLNFVKIDVEGMEYEAIKGGGDTWKKYLPVIYYETIQTFEIKRKEPTLKYIENLLSEIGYNFYKVAPDGTITETSYPELNANTLAVPEIKKRLFNI